MDREAARLLSERVLLRSILFLISFPITSGTVILLLAVLPGDIADADAIAVPTWLVLLYSLFVLVAVGYAIKISSGIWYLISIRFFPKQQVERCVSSSPRGPSQVRAAAAHVRRLSQRLRRVFGF